MTDMAIKSETVKKEVAEKTSIKPDIKQQKKRKLKTKKSALILPTVHFSKISYQIVVSVIFGMALMLLFYLTVHPQQQQQIATVDVSKIVDEFVKGTAQKKLPPEKMQSGIEAFGKKLEGTLKTMADDKHLILMPNEAVITGAKDITEQVRKELVRA